MEDFDHGLDSILKDFVSAPKLDAFLDEVDAILSSASLGFLHLVSTLSDTFRPQLAPSMKTCKL